MSNFFFFQGVAASLVPLTADRFRATSVSSTRRRDRDVKVVPSAMMGISSEAHIWDFRFLHHGAGFFFLLHLDFLSAWDDGVVH